MSINIRDFVIVSCAAFALLACTKQESSNDSISSAQGAKASEAPTVEVAAVVSERISEWDEFTGRLQAADTVVLMPRVSGYIQQVHFKEGTFVEQGELLIQLDPAPFNAEVARLRAELRSAQTAARLARNNFQRAEQLSSKQAISAELLDNRKAAQEQAGAMVRSATAALHKAQLDLSYTSITAPISGRVSYALITAGNYVIAGESQLTHLVSLDKMYAYFEVDEQSYLKYSQQVGANQWASDSYGQTHPVYLSLANAEQPTFLGHIDFVDNRVNKTTGTIRLRASFDNSEHILIPGLYAHIKLHGSDAYQGILIDEKAIGTDLNNKFVLVANNDVLEYRAVKLGEQINGLRIVKQGLNANEQIVVNGLQRVRANMHISPKIVDMASIETLSLIRHEQKRVEQSSVALTAQINRQPNRG
ncbi:efflux RND transporter periplasmic adaptor subunit [Paraglaciecola hydrolytica]|uniref:Efflux transporter periplasmic adaptor subunit n=1 Tax=Paraglaciecola hydrolytica TaxID=1799789 RepID=A0A136A6V2_9ALTE|nr:efflux RND transporter periplasmic adaptor subunit [Paraglaciecola hydrolytica]KXI30963.1 efflux transporter periplasmic adaptor subunit [Paraglaciecola hydrolytica]